LSHIDKRDWYAKVRGLSSSIGVKKEPPSICAVTDFPSTREGIELIIQKKEEIDVFERS
jgi:hypothetical protein